MRAWDILMQIYNISSVIEFYALSGYGKSKDIYWEMYVALCNAFGIPLDWEKQHEDRRAEKNSIIYKHYRRIFQEPLVEMYGELCYSENGIPGIPGTAYSLQLNPPRRQNVFCQGF